jgi:hypothetical protein
MVGLVYFQVGYSRHQVSRLEPHQDRWKTKAWWVRLPHHNKARKLRNGYEAWLGAERFSYNQTYQGPCQDIVCG